VKKGILGQIWLKNAIFLFLVLKRIGSSKHIL